MTEPVQTLFERALATLPAPLRVPVLEYWREYPASFVPPTDPQHTASLMAGLPAVFAASEFVARTCLQHPALLAELADTGDLLRAYGPQELRTRVLAIAAECGDDAALKSALRRVRRREMLRIAWRDLAGWADLGEVLATLTALAEGCIDGALARLMQWAVERDGTPRSAAGDPAHLVVLGMGKLGGGELNFSSDIDLIFAYSEEGEVQGGPRELSNHEFFIRLGRSLISALNDATAEGFVFRVDMRLRPNGDSGPLALSFDAMEQYYQVHGREWERYAFIKARAVAGDGACGTDLFARLKPFVYRRYLDYSVVEAIRGLKMSIERELHRKGMQHNIKLGPGGIREIEFIGQAFQLIRGGREPALQVRPIQTVLTALQAGGYLTPQAVADLQAAYVFLRRAENRLQMAADRQTHSLPPEAQAQLALAFAMGYDDWADFHAALRRHMHKVHGHFEQVFVAPQGEKPEVDDRGLAAVWLATLDSDGLHRRLAQAGFQDPVATETLLHGLRAGHAYEGLSAQGRERLDRLMPLLLGAAGLTGDPQTTLARLIKLIEAIVRRSVYLALLVENPMALSQLVKLFSASDWIARWISQHPVLLDELIDPVSLYVPLAKDALEAEIQGRLAHLPEDDLEAQMEALREFRHGHVLRVAAADVGPGLTPEQAGAHLGHIAEVVVEQALALATYSMVEKHGRPACKTPAGVETPGFAVIAYGKLGSLELGYTSDLDIIFLHAACAGEGMTQGPRPLANEVFFARLGQRLIHILTARTPAGILYQVDMRLRPSGQSGMLVTNLPAFLEYQRGHAWTWEHQALVRARALAGDPALCRAFEDARTELLCRPRDEEKLRRDVLEMRTRMRAALPAHDVTHFDLKQDPGGMIDIEFMVQYWTLLRAPAHPELTRQRGNIPLLEALAGAGLLDAGTARDLMDAYRRYLSVEHRFKLMERQALVAPEELGDYPAKVAAIWEHYLLSK
jgi:glutamate-ammonia-ligase adenylyltransferase